MGHLGDVPDINVFQKLFRKLKRGKAHGEDGLPPQILKLPAQMTDLFYPIMLKSALTIREPLQWRGCEEKEIDKPGKDPAKDGTKAMRGVAIAEIPSKVYHRAVRATTEGP